MAAIDYEAEYNNRARVPEHGDIFARWTREAAGYRAARKADAALDLLYGTTARQYLDLFPAKSSGEDAPLAMFVHGGYWRSLDPSQFSHMAAGLNAHGIDVAVAGYDLCPQVTIGQIIGEIRAACLFLWRTHQRRLTVYGHSAGGHLAACMAGTDWKKFSPDAPENLVPSAYSLSGVFDLNPLLNVSMNQDLRLDAKSAREVSPLFWTIPPGRTLDAAVGSLESSEFLRQSRIIADGWGMQKALTDYVEIAGANHFTIVDALSDPNSNMAARIAEMCRGTQALKL
jgi:arylformamidase